MHKYKIRFTLSRKDSSHQTQTIIEIINKDTMITARNEAENLADSRTQLDKSWTWTVKAVEQIPSRKSN